MYKQFKIILNSRGAKLPPNCSYRLYAWLLKQLPQSIGSGLHKQGETNIAQYLYRDKDQEDYIWVLNVLDPQLSNLVFSVLDRAQIIDLHDRTVLIRSVTAEQFGSPEELAISGEFFRFTFRSATSFKQRGHASLFPMPELIVKSAGAKWNSVFQKEVQDFTGIAEGLFVEDYRLFTTRFQMKGNYIPGCLGTMNLRARLAGEELFLWQQLAGYINYCGLGVKTGLGMGGVQVECIDSKIR